MAHETILVSDDSGVRTITLNRPDDLNAIDDRLTAELQAELKNLARDRAVRCLVLTGAGRAFSAGQDLKSASSRGADFDFTGALRRRYNPIISALKKLEIPVIASINGVAAGAGWSLALACDLRIASSQAKFVGAFSKIGLIPDSGMTWVLPRLVGFARALEIAWFGEPLSARQALDWGLVNRLAEPAELSAATREWALKLAQGPTRAYGLIKRSIAAAIEKDLDSQLEYEALLQGAAGKTSDYAEGLNAFIEKRQPEFKGE